jgi:DNA-binding NarL/FixJ family response regulator
VDMRAVRRLQAQGEGQRGIARRLGVSVNTLRKSITKEKS